MVRVLSSWVLALLVVLAAEIGLAVDQCQLYFAADVRSVQDFKAVANFALENHAYHTSMNSEVLSHFVQELPKFMDSYKIIFEESDIVKFMDSNSKMVTRIQKDLDQNKVKRMEVLFARYQMRVAELKKLLLSDETYKNEILNKAAQSQDLEIPGWGRTPQDVFENAKTFLAMQIRMQQANGQPLEDSYILAKRTLSRYLEQWDPAKKDNQLLELMSHSFVSGLDPFSKFQSKEELTEDANAPARRYFVGIAMAEALKGVLVTEVIANSAAEKAGLVKGDIIIRMQNEILENMAIKDFLRKLNEVPSAVIDFRISRDGQEFNVKVARDFFRKKLKIQTQTMVSRHGQLVSIKLNDFTEGASQIFLTGLNEAFKKGAVAGIVLDLRGNPGGYVHEAMQVLRAFLRKQPVLVYQTQGEIAQVIDFSTDHPILDIPLVILVNEGSASAAELVSGVLQAEKRALVIGVRTFGKGTAHSVIQNGFGGMQLTQKFFHFTNGESPQLKGVTPDIHIEREIEDAKFAADLDYALPEQELRAVDRSKFAETRKEEFFESLKKVLIKRSLQRQKETSTEKEDVELKEAFQVLTDWAELLKNLQYQVPRAS